MYCRFLKTRYGGWWSCPQLPSARWILNSQLNIPGSRDWSSFCHQQQQKASRKCRVYCVFAKISFMHVSKLSNKRLESPHLKTKPAMRSSCHDICAHKPDIYRLICFSQGKLSCYASEIQIAFRYSAHNLFKISQCLTGGINICKL